MTLAVLAREAERAVAEHALAIEDVPEHFLHAPLAGRVAVEGAGR